MQLLVLYLLCQLRRVCNDGECMIGRQEGWLISFNHKKADTKNMELGEQERRVEFWDELQKVKYEKKYIIRKKGVLKKFFWEKKNTIF